MSAIRFRVKRFQLITFLVIVATYMLLNGIFLINGRNDIVLAWLIVTILLLPSTVLAFRSRSFSLKLFFGLCFITQFLGVPWFVAYKEVYAYSGWNAVKSFGFKPVEFFWVYLPLGALLLLVVFFSHWLKPIFQASALSLRETKIPNFGEDSSTRKGRGLIYQLIIILLLLALVPLNLWMFKNGISMTGVKPPNLPFKLAGILHYFTKYVIPALFFYLYSKTSRGLPITVMLLVYAVFMGTTQVSRSAMVFMLMPVVFYAIIDNRRTLLVMSSVWALFGLQVASLMRNVIYVVKGGKSGAETSAGLVSSIETLLRTQADRINLIDMGMSMVFRVESPQRMVLGYQYDPDAIGGVGVLIKRVIYNGWATLDHSAHHMEFIAMKVPKGFFTGVGLLSNAVSIIHASPLLTIFLALLWSFHIGLADFFAHKISIKYNSGILKPFIIALYLMFMFRSLGSVVFWGLVLTLLFLNFFPKVSFKTIRINSRDLDSSSI